MEWYFSLEEGRHDYDGLYIGGGPRDHHFKGDQVGIVDGDDIRWCSSFYSTISRDKKKE